MKKIFAILALIVMPGFAFAQSANTTTQVGTRALSGSLSQVNQYSTVPQHTTSTSTVDNVPQVVPPGIYGGTNVCAVGASGGVSALGFGVSGGGEWTDPGCEKRSEAVVLYQMGQHAGAVALMCQFHSVYNAMIAAGTPCPVGTQPVQNVSMKKMAPMNENNKPQPPKQTCQQVFVAPANPNGAGELVTRCFPQ